MTDPRTASDEERDAWSRYFAVETFNRSWALLEQADRSADDDATLLALAFASRRHWSQVGTAENVALGDHQIAKAAAAAGLGDLSLRFAARAALVADTEGWDGWKRAAVHEGLARAHHARGDEAERDRSLAEARRALELVDDPEDREVIESQLRELPGWS